MKSTMPRRSASRSRFLLAALGFSLSIAATGLHAADTAVGQFEAHGDVGSPPKAGAVQFDARRGRYTVTGGGANMWFTNDAFHFVWRRVSGDVRLTADIDWLGSGGNAHRKACLMLRQDLTPGSAYADAALHGDGLTSLQFRDEAGGLTHEIQSRTAKPHTLRLERYGDTVSISVSGPGDSLQPGGGSYQLQLHDPVYVGLGVCAHDDQATETAVFSKVQLHAEPHVPTTNLVVESTLETVAIASTDRRAIYCARDHFEAPNWTRDGAQLLFNQHGRIYRLPAGGGEPEVVDTGFATRCNNDHGLSPDGARLAISDQSRGGASVIYTLPAAGGEPRQITPRGPSYWHGWSPDGATLAYCAERNGEFDVYTIPAAGGTETRLTTAAGLDDGPEYSPDGRYIYFNSERSGRMQIWRMRPDGGAQEQVTNDGRNNWFPHLSPDGRWLVFLSYEPEVKGHPANQPVTLRLMPTGGGVTRTLAKLFGGQGTINVPSWAPDSRQLAFVSYRLVPAAKP